jgi:membrane-associated phospholipid phosphatase
MFPFERLAIVYFALFGVGALLTVPDRPRRWRAILGAGASVMGVIVIASTSSITVRVWLAHAYLVAGYWLPALLVGTISAAFFEAWLVRTDTRVREYLLPLPRWATHLAELSYLMCYPALPAAFTVVWTRGNLVDAERFWASVLAAGFVCYGNLPWLPSRPPRLLDSLEGRKHASIHQRAVGTNDTPNALASLNTAVLDRVSHQFNTFPSGHVAVAVAAAASTFTVWWPAGVALAIVAAGIAVGAGAGRYHYVVDVILGVVVGLGAVTIFAVF